MAKITSTQSFLLVFLVAFAVVLTPSSAGPVNGNATEPIGSATAGGSVDSSSRNESIDPAGKRNSSVAADGDSMKSRIDDPARTPVNTSRRTDGTKDDFHAGSSVNGSRANDDTIDSSINGVGGTGNAVEPGRANNKSAVEGPAKPSANVSRSIDDSVNTNSTNGGVGATINAVRPDGGYAKSINDGSVGTGNVVKQTSGSTGSAAGRPAKVFGATNKGNPGTYAIGIGGKGVPLAAAGQASGNIAGKVWAGRTA
ncbi:OLC1v1015832C1 [Oldenlandia corymbosa var. corymbosa]|uniref:OLC1v1015832C1 n=1 Tax=Oldenlandia corymbosa var. corymbosa TaxID=529605 RepID=A0AAV1E6Y4_OLDCO|nr:OLC1v1015832C1 [Oldenlandia corymbosa var. corymbosa]